MNIEFESDYRLKILYVRFEEGSRISCIEDVREFRRQWTLALKAWHSPYKALIDVSQLEISKELPDEAKRALNIMFKFLKGLFLRDSVGFGKEFSELPFPTFTSRDEAEAKLGVRKQGHVESTDFRSLLFLENHFKTHTVELSLRSPATIETQEQMKILKDKLTNNLMQWHSKWNLLIDCTHLQIDPSMDKQWASLHKYLNGFFLKKLIGYSPCQPDSTYPFDVYRSRHRAAAVLEAEGLTAGDDAQCRSRMAT
jgi:hypothetical protein